MSNNIKNYLKFTSLQLATEALLYRPDSGGEIGQIEYGNNRSTKSANVAAQHTGVPAPKSDSFFRSYTRTSAMRQGHNRHLKIGLNLKIQAKLASASAH